MFNFFKQTSEQKLYSRIWPTDEDLSLFKPSNSYPKIALRASTAIANFTLATEVLLGPVPDTRAFNTVRKVERMIFEELGKHADCYQVKDILLLETERNIWRQGACCDVNVSSTVNTIFPFVLSERMSEYVRTFRKDLVRSQTNPGHSGLSYFSKSYLSHILGIPILNPDMAWEEGLSDCIPLLYFTMLMTDIIEKSAQYR